MIPADAVNDDYCDCPEDGSDEPGTCEATGWGNARRLLTASMLFFDPTAACPGGKFYCVNRNHHGFYIPSSRVGDGVCGEWGGSRLA